MRPRTSLTALVLLILAAALFPRPAAASLPIYRELGAELLETAENPPQLLAALEDAEQREDEREGCGVFCGEPLDLRLKVGLFGEDHERAWGFFGPPTPTGPNKYARSRFYAPMWGRFITQDTFPGKLDEPPSLNLFAYAHDRPTFWTDPTGHAPGDWWDPRSHYAFHAARELERAFVEPSMDFPTLGLYGGVKRGIDEGRVGWNPVSWATSGLEGMARFLSAGAVDIGVEARAGRGKGALESVYLGASGAGKNLVLEALATQERRDLADPTKSGWEKTAAFSSLTSKTALLAAGGRALAQRGFARAGAPTAEVVVESPTVTETTTLAPAPGTAAGRQAIAGASPGAAQTLATETTPAVAPNSGARGTASGYEPLRPHPTDPNVPGGAANYRGRYNAALDAEGQTRLPADWDVHHSVPQQLRGDPRLQGIDIDAPSQMRGVPGYRQPGPQTNVHSLMDQEWRQFLRSNPNATRQELLNFRDYQDWRFQHTFWESQVRTKP